MACIQLAPRAARRPFGSFPSSRSVVPEPSGAPPSIPAPPPRRNSQKALVACCLLLTDLIWVTPTPCIGQRPFTSASGHRPQELVYIRLLPMSRIKRGYTPKPAARTCFEGPRFVPHGYQKAADLPNRSALGLLGRNTRKCSARLAFQPCGFSTAPWSWRSGPREFGLSSLRRGKSPRRWKSRRAGARALRYSLAGNFTRIFCPQLALWATIFRPLRGL